MIYYLNSIELLQIAEVVTTLPMTTLHNVVKRDLLQSACEAPFSTFDGVDLYPTLFDKASVLGFQIAKNHPLPDGNKRLAFLATYEFMWINGYEIITDESDFVTTFFELAAGNISRTQLANWIEAKSVSRTTP